MFRLIFFLILFGVPSAALLWWWWADRLVRRWARPRLWRSLVGLPCGLFLTGFAWLVIGRMLEGSSQPPPSLQAFLLIWGLVVLPFFAAPLALLWSGWQGGRKLLGRTATAPPTKTAEPHPAPSQNQTTEPCDPEPALLSRRDLLGLTAVAAPLMLTSAGWLYGMDQTWRFRIRRMTLAIPHLPKPLEGMTLAHLTDSHVGKFTRGAILDRIAEATNQLAPDFVLFTGDLIDAAIADLPEAIAMLQKLQPRHGLHIVEGNHDLFEGRELFERGIRSAGLSLLIDQTAVATYRGYPVQFLGARWPGRRDPGGQDRSIALLANQREPEAFPILLAHHPHAFDAAVQHQIPLTLAGHTHGGQLMLTPRIGVGPMMFRYWSGRYEQHGCQLVVSNGVGNWFPVRTAAPAEIVHLTLTRAS